MLVFWTKGFLGASLSDLTTSMGINKPSLYGAFGNKEELFISCTQHYLEQHAMPNIELLSAEGLPFTERLSNYLHAVIQIQCHPHYPKGCFISLCANETASDHMPPQAVTVINSIQSLNEEHLLAFFQAEKECGNIGAENDEQVLTRYIMTLIHGTASLARSGKSLEDIQTIIKPVINTFQMMAMSSQPHS
nr:TetR/AcrR family transcriptional regulator [Pleionea sp. CnH1-48]